ncbi:autotransporter domain-containing protein [Kordiimonas pumila]|uniref:Autotransporter domain-containing protein n=1 Tax=Kordiimonas pumila TaxID=2161677 RepID=A0ABV7D4B1_9PROT|nr:autotransporter domain-containing protein [Kordiimonas pumila]
MKRRYFQRTLSLTQNTRNTLLACCSALTLITGQAAADAGDGNWYFFGDSNLGQGNFSAIVGSRGEDFYPNSSNNGFERDSNGLIWAEMMGRDVDIILDPDLNTNNINFAISGAHMTRGGDLVPYGVETGVLVQTEAFRDLVSAGSITPNTNDVAFMIAGANDFLDRMEAGEDAESIATDVIGATLENIETLSATGIKTVIISELQPLQYAPIFTGDTETQAALGDMVSAVNDAMTSAIAESGLTGDINVVTLKYADLMAYLTENASTLGFDNTDTACLNSDTGAICAADKAGQNRHLFLDGLHMTEKGHSYVARWWSATLAGANGSAARMTSRMPDAVQFSAEMAQTKLNRHIGKTSAGKLNLFADVLYATPEMKGLGTNPSMDLTMKGGLVGLETALSDRLYVGGSISFMDTEAELSGESSFKASTKALHAWASYGVPKLNFTLTGQYGDARVKDINRDTGLPNYIAGGKTKGEFWNIGAGLATNYQIGAFNIRLDGTYYYGKVDLNGYSETGVPGLGLTYGGQNKTSQWIESNTLIEAPSFRIGNSVEVQPFAGTAWRYRTKGDSHDLTAQLSGNTAAPATIKTVATAKDRYSAEAGVKMMFSDKVAVTTRYSRLWATDLKKGDTFHVGLNVTF